MNPIVKTVVFWLVIILAATLLWQVVKNGSHPATEPISYSAFLSQVDGGNVGKVAISGSHITGIFRDGEPFQTLGPTSQEGMLHALREKNVEIWFKDAAPQDWPTWLLNLAPLILLAALWFFMIRQIQTKRSQTPTNPYS